MTWVVSFVNIFKPDCESKKNKSPSASHFYTVTMDADRNSFWFPSKIFRLRPMIRGFRINRNVERCLQWLYMFETRLYWYSVLALQVVRAEYGTEIERFSFHLFIFTYFSITSISNTIQRRWNRDHALPIEEAKIIIKLVCIVRNSNSFFAGLIPWRPTPGPISELMLAIPILEQHC